MATWLEENRGTLLAAHHAFVDFHFGLNCLLANETLFASERALATRSYVIARLK
jgi:hypothetical protein